MFGCLWLRMLFYTVADCLIDYFELFCCVLFLDCALFCFVLLCGFVVCVLVV